MSENTGETPRWRQDAFAGQRQDEQTREPIHLPTIEKAIEAVKAVEAWAVRPRRHSV